MGKAFTAMVWLLLNGYEEVRQVVVDVWEDSRGKGTICEVLKRLNGPTSYLSTSLEDLANEFGLMV